MIFSAAEAYLGQAVHGMRRRFPGADVRELAPEVGRIELPGLGASEVADACHQAAQGPGLAFVRHLAVEEAFVPDTQLDRVPDVARKLVVAGMILADVGLQVWGSGKVARRPPELRAGIEAALAQANVATARGGREQVLGVCLTPTGAHVGVTPSQHMLADWPGGRVILGRPAEQVSRAEWKLEELFKLLNASGSTRLLSVTLCSPLCGAARATARAQRDMRALDLGASPGGWTRILRSKGYEVWAVDPGELHPAVAADPGVHHEATTAGRFLATTDVVFDLVVNDMRMVAEQSCEVMVRAAKRLRPGGVAVMTLKVSQRRPVPTVERALDVLSRAYEPVFVRQLYHNKNEVTVVAHRHRS